MAARNLINLNSVGKERAARTILEKVTLGISEHERIGVVGANGAGKSTLLALIAGVDEPDSGAVVTMRDLRCELLDQRDRLYISGHTSEFASGSELADGSLAQGTTHPNARIAARTVAEAVLGQRAEHEWAADPRFRAVLDGLLGGTSFDRFNQGAQTPVESLSGGERRRVALAQALTANPGLLALDEPTNHLDVEAITWLADYLVKAPGALLVVTHDRWFLDAVCTDTWEVADTTVHRYEGGYSAYVLAKAERERIAAVREDRRRQLIRKELAWLRRGPPARTSKPKFRIEAANALIADEPPARDGTELLRFASRRLGTKVIEAEAIGYAYPAPGPTTPSDERPTAAGDKRSATNAPDAGRPPAPLINDLTWRLGPGDRFALVGVNGSGKSTLLALLAGELEPQTGRIERGETVHLAHLTQTVTDLPQSLSALAAVEQVRKQVRLADGSELSAARMIERLGFPGDRARTLVKDLSGGERRRLALARLLMGEPNVLILDEPTNDLDIETLRALEDLLDRFAGTLLVVSHDRYFVERVCDNVYALDRIGGIRHLPGGIEQYLDEVSAPGAGPAGPAPGQRARLSDPQAVRAAGDGAGGGSSGATAKPGAQLREARKTLARLDRELEKLGGLEAELHESMAAAAADHERLSALTAELRELAERREALELAWLEAAELADG